LEPASHCAGPVTSYVHILSAKPVQGFNSTKVFEEPLGYSPSFFSNAAFA
jgi:hypothetical protein